MVEPTPKEWPLYDMKDRQVMVLDEFDIHTAKESELKIVDDRSSNNKSHQLGSLFIDAGPFLLFRV